MLTIHECSFSDRRCETYGCTNHRGHRKFYLGRPDVEVPKPVACEPCVKNMLAHVPLEFAGAETADHVEYMKDKMQAEHDAEFAAYRAHTEALVKKQYAAFLEDREREVAEAAEQSLVLEDPKEATPKTHRCLDCDIDFTSAAKLKAHKETHKGE